MPGTAKREIKHMMMWDMHDRTTKEQAEKNRK
jgi:hypothetical protein